MKNNHQFDSSHPPIILKFDFIKNNIEYLITSSVNALFKEKTFSFKT